MPDSNENKQRISATVDFENARHLEHVADNKSKLINRLLTAHRVGGDAADKAVKRMREQQLESERRQLEVQLQSVEDDLQQLKRAREAREEERAELREEAFDVLSQVTVSPDNPAVENWARKLAMTPHELIQEYEDRDDE